MRASNSTRSTSSSDTMDDKFDKPALALLLEGVNDLTRRMEEIVKVLAESASAMATSAKNMAQIAARVSKETGKGQKLISNRRASRKLQLGQVECHLCKQQLPLDGFISPDAFECNDHTCVDCFDEISEGEFKPTNCGFCQIRYLVYAKDQGHQHKDRVTQNRPNQMLLDLENEDVARRLRFLKKRIEDARKEKKYYPI